MREKKYTFVRKFIGKTYIMEQKYTLRECLGTAMLGALQAGKEIMNIYDDPAQDFGIERKADNSPLTLADKASHKVIVGHLQPIGLPVLSEEGEMPAFEERSKWGRYWLIDPLDGTKEFIKKNGEFTVNIALMEEGKPIAGVVYLPAKDIAYAGVVGEGALRIDKALELSTGGVTGVESILELMSKYGKQLPLQSAKHDGYVIVASRSHLSPETQAYIDEAEKKYDNVKCLSSGSSIKLCLVAEGAADAYPRYAPTMEWDTAAADAVVRAAGFMTYQAGSYDGIESENGMPLVYNKVDLHNPWFLVK